MKKKAKEVLLKVARRKSSRTSRKQKGKTRRIEERAGILEGASQNRISKTPKEGDIFDSLYRTRIRVIGIGGGGGNMVSEIAARVQKADFVVANTDLQALKEVPRKVKAFAFGQQLTHGLGCGMKPEIGEQAAGLEKERIKKLFEGQDILIFTACLGGGTSSGAAPVFAELAKEFKSLTIGVFTTPFSFEGERKKQIAQQALEKLRPFLNAYVLIPNERIFQIVEKETPLKEAFSAVNRRLAAALEGLIETISFPGLINIDFADVRATLEGRGKLAYVNSATASGVGKVQEVLHEALFSPLCEYGIERAERMLFNITGDRNLKMQEVAEISKTISDNNPKAKIILGLSCTPRFKEKVRITLFAVGCQEKEAKALGRGSKEKDLAPAIEKKPSLKRKAKSVQRRKEGEQRQKEKSGSQESLPLGAVVVQQAQPNVAAVVSDSEHVRRNALEVRKATDKEMKELQEKERKWDIPSFLRNKSSS